MTQPAPARAWTPNRICMLIGVILFVLASLAKVFGWDVDPWALAFGGFAAWMLAGCI